MCESPSRIFAKVGYDPSCNVSNTQIRIFLIPNIDKIIKTKHN